MANRFWVGGNATWDATAGTKWSATSGGAGGASVPTSSDDVFFNAASGAVTCTLGANTANLQSINFTGFTGTFAFSTRTLSSRGNVTFAAGMTVTVGTGRLSFESTGTRTLTTAGKSMPQVDINSLSTLSLGDALTISTGTSRSLSNSGVLTTNNFSITASGQVASVSGTAPTFNLGSSAISCREWFIINTGTLTINGGTSTITCTANLFDVGTSTGTYPNVVFSGDVSSTLTGAANITSFSLTASITAQRTFTLTANPTIGTLVLSGSSVLNRILLLSNLPGTRRTLTVTTWSTISDIDFQDIGLNSLRSGTRLGNWGNNNNITFVTRTVYWNLAGVQSFTAAGWATTSGGAPALNNFPLAQDTMVFDNAGAATTVSFNQSYVLGNITASAKTSAYTLSGAIYLLGNATFGGAVSANFNMLFGSTGAQTINSGGVTIGGPINKTASSGTSGSLSLAAAITSTSSLTVSASNTFSTGNFSATFGSLTSTGSTINIGSSTFSVTGSGVSFNIGGVTFSGTGTISMTSASAKTFAGGGLSYSGVTLNQGGAGALTIVASNTFGNITNTYGATGATSILFTAGTTNTFTNWNANGQSGRLLTIGSDTAASHTLSKSSGTVNANFLSISRSNATGGAVWNAGANSIDNGNNTGWVFGSPGGGNFIAFFM